MSLVAALCTETIELTKLAYLDIIAYPDRVLDGWRHVNICLQR